MSDKRNVRHLAVDFEIWEHLDLTLEAEDLHWKITVDGLARYLDGFTSLQTLTLAFRKEDPHVWQSSLVVADGVLGTKFGGVDDFAFLRFSLDKKWPDWSEGEFVTEERTREGLEVEKEIVLREVMRLQCMYKYIELPSVVV